VKKIIQATLLSLSVASIAACGPSNTSEVSLVDIAQAAARKDDRESVEDVASWLIEGRGDFKLIDVRTPEDFASGHIGDAENIPITKIVAPPDISAEELDGESLQVSEQRAYACYFVGERSGSAARRNISTEPFVPPVYNEAEEEPSTPLPPAGEESC
jgi:rhodanese-related sulfurtransferase